ncbi:MAG: hypothetical protein ABI548_01660 [Polyangiaceae bacterium]
MTTILDVAAAIQRSTKLEPLTPRWEATLRAFYGLPLREVDVANLLAATKRSEPRIRALSDTRKAKKELWCRVGRRGRKSYTMALVAVFEAMFGGHERYLVPGERGLIAVISKDVAGSEIVARFCELHARALGLETNWTSMGSVRILQIEGSPFGIACFPCNAKAPRGSAVPVIVADELAHWATDSDEYVNSDDAVLGAVKPAQAQFPDSKLVAISSPLGTDGIHYETIEANLGDGAESEVLAVEGPTWEWNNDITEARTHEIEKDPETHAREFGARPSGNEGTAFVGADVMRSFEHRDGFYTWEKPFLVIDPGETMDTFAVAAFCWGKPSSQLRPRMLKLPGTDYEYTPDRDANGAIQYYPLETRKLLSIYRVEGWTGDVVRSLGMEVIVGQIAQVARELGIQQVVSDQRGAPYLSALFKPHHLRFRSFPWTMPRKHESVILLRALMRDGQLLIAEHTEMQRQLLRYKRRIVGGNFKYGTPRERDDFAALLVTLGMMELEERGTSTEDTHIPTGHNLINHQSTGRHVAAGR